jgi:hypothetical protein
MTSPVNQHEVVTQVRNAFDKYEQALIDNDVNKMNTFFWDAAETIRYGIDDVQYGAEAIYRWRANAQPVSPQRRLHNTIITTFGTDFATVSTGFYNGVDPSMQGRQMQTWVRLGSTSDDNHGWKIVAAHVSLIQAP